MTTTEPAATSSAVDAPETVQGGHVLARMLQAHGVGPMFGMAGFQLLPFYDAVAELGLQHYLINDERTGAFAADAYARLTGRPGVCDGTLGPGATNLVTGLVESLNAGIPVIALAGDTNRAHAWKNMTQEARQVEILRPAAKDLIRIEDPLRIPEAVRRAFAIATSGRPGPVVLDVPEDVAHAWVPLAESDVQVDPDTLEVPARRVRPEPVSIARAAAAIASARRPLILAGGGIHLSRAYESLARFAETFRVPVAHTMSGKGSIACTHPLSAGLFGRYSRIANDLIAQADVLLVVGCKLGEIATKRYDLLPDDATVIQIDVEADELGRTQTVTHPIWADAALALDDLASELSDRVDTLAPTFGVVADEVPGRMERWRDEARQKLESTDTPVHMGRLITEINRVLPVDGVLVADGGFAGHWSGLLFDTKRAGRTFVADRGFASIGYGLPGAIGAALARPGGPVVALTGDGGFNMSIGDLETAIRLQLDLTVVVVNNAASGYVKALQHVIYSGRYQSADLHELDYAAIATAYGARGLRVDDPADLETTLRTAIEPRGGPTVVDVRVTRDPGQMLPGVDSRTAVIKPGDRIA
jgi:acetolactate synthase-1/2/3 large subunit